MNNKWREFFNDEEPKYEYEPNLSLLSEDDFDELEDYSDILNEAEELLDEKKGKKRKAAKKKHRKKKKKAKGKKDACYHKVRSRYDVWPSAYASGALVKCRKVGAKNWGNSTKEELELDEDLLEEIIQEENEETLEEKKKRKKKGRKLSSKPSSESSLRDWFKRKGAKGSKGGWVDCNAPDGKGGYKSCGRGSGEKRKRYPACRPTPGACKKMKGSKGKSWGKKDSKRRGKKK